MSTPKKHIDRAWLAFQYYQLRKSTAAIGRECGVSSSTIWYRMIDEGLKIRSRGEAHRGKRYQINKPYRNPQWLTHQYHDLQKSIQDIASELHVAPNTVSRSMKALGVRRRSFSEIQKMPCWQIARAAKIGKFAGDKSAQWRGGRLVCRGYVLLHKRDHPGADQKGYVREHRLVAEQSTGRALQPTEVVHHIDFDRSNNAPVNLVVMGRGEHWIYHRQMNHLFEHWLGA